MFVSHAVKQAIRLCVLANLIIMNGFSEGSKVALRQSPEGMWELLRNGKPMKVWGVGGTQNLGLAKAMGANSIRVWDTEQLLAKNDQGQTVLEELEQNDLTFCAGIWVQHERHGFSYLNAEKIREQREKLRAAVRRYKNHPNLLVWGLGNEMEIFPGQPEAVRVWKEMEALATIVKEEDPDHPVMTVIAGADVRKIKEVMEHYPSIDILGINAYSGAGGAGATLQSLGWKKPFMLTEYGTSGHWEVPKTAWGAPMEPNANEKAAQYYATLQAVTENKEGLALGSYAFLWGHKQETTSTWYGMLLPSGEKLPSVDAVVKGWTGRWPANRSPKIESFGFDESLNRGKAGTRVKAKAVVSDRDGDSLAFEWKVMAESRDIRHGGDAESVPRTYPKAVTPGEGGECTVIFPAKGAYRLFLVVRDGQGGASTANLPFLSE
jgi:hypothetical protein